ncbi:PAS domain-containing protein [Lujinxingia vulgaris]|uniref:histidine kinase n=1 Tax=Lujinxingia vulgaris TaxID=2600176 RepID=A0A5C6XBX1_9DELT|nr:ATP-binding protein [Lujinxingia vulgaris]TXD38911.1 PAS domain-containing protein [Lujinxingia vulgaris]
MFLSFRSKIFAIAIALIGLFVLIATLAAHHTLRGWTQSRIESDLLQRARLIDASLDPEGDLSAQVLRLSEASQTRITLIAADGEVLADSHVDQPEALDDHGDRPEVQAALTQGVGLARRHSSSIDADLLYGAIPASATEGAAVVRLSVPLSEVDEVLNRLRTLALIGALVALAIAIFLSGIATRLMSSTLQNLLIHAREATDLPDDTQLPGAEPGVREPTSSRSVRQLTEALERSVGSLARERDRFSAVLDGMAEGVVATDAHLTVTLVNRAARALLGLEGNPQGRDLADLLPAAPLEQLIGGAHSARGASAEFQLTAPLTRTILARAAWPKHGPGLILVLHDVTELRRLETVRRDFVANVSHELRTPVAVIQANSETLLSGALDDPKAARNFTRGIYRNAERLTHLIADLLDIARLEADQAHLEPRHLPARQAAADAIEALHAPDDAAITLEIAADLQVLADPRALDQILINLLDNALKYLPEPGPIIVRASRDAEATMARFEVIDQGPGIEPRHHHRLFERFYRVDKGRAAHMGGTGLGLSIVKHLVSAQGGEVGYEPNQPHGSIFWFTLPLATADA